MLFLAQILSWQFLVPLWVLLYLLTSPSAIKAAPTTILVDIKDIKVLPLTVTISMLIPTVLMFLPPSMISAKWHYASFAFWQPFPLWHYLLHKLATTTYSAFDESRSQETRYKAYLSAVRPIYNLVFFAGVIGQLPVLLALLPTVQRSQFVDHMPSLRDYTSVTISSIFMPWSPLDMPTHNSKTIVSGELAMTAVCFLHYDMYIGCGAILAGALYLHRSAVRREKLGFLLMKLLGWFAIGGFPGAISALLFERDRYVVERSEKKSV